MFPPKGAVAPLYLNTIPDIAAVPVLWVFISGLIIATFVDFDHFIIPDSVSIGGMVAGIILSALVPSLHGQSLWTNGLIASVTGLLAGFLPLQFVRVGSTFLYRKLGRIDNDEYAMGFGDIKLIGAIGAFTGWQGAVFAMISAAFYGTIIAIPFLVSGRKKLIDRIPFGPYLALGALTWIFWSERILYFYFGLLRPPA
jgi:leader peptidase (prepilin peptidase)/N-methyltransferase